LRNVQGVYLQKNLQVNVFTETIKRNYFILSKLVGLRMFLP